MVALNMGDCFIYCSLVPSLLPQPIREQVSRTPRPPSREVRTYKWAVCSLSTHLYGFSTTCLVVYINQPGISWTRSLVSQVPLCSDPRKFGKTKYNLSSGLVYTPTSKQLCPYLHLIFLSTNQLDVSDEILYLALSSVQNVQITLLQVVLNNKTQRGPNS